MGPGDRLIEHRAARLEVRGRTIAGLAVPWGERASVLVAGERVGETFVRGAFGPDGNLRPVPLTVEHGGPRVGLLTPSSTDRGLEVRGSYEGGLGGRDRFSVEFRAKGETRSGGLRIVHDATLHGVAAVTSPAYDGAVIEARRRLGSVSGSLPKRRGVGCRCSFTGRNAARTARVETVEVDGSDLLAYLSDVKRPVGRAVMRDRRNRVDVAVSLDDRLPAAREIAALASLGIPLRFRPFPDREKSEWVEVGNEDRYSKLVVSAWILIPGNLAGEDIPEAEVEDEGRERRTWLS